MQTHSCKFDDKVMDAGTQAILFIVALVFSAGFLTLVILLGPAIREMKALFVDLQKTSAEVRELAGEMKKISVNVEEKLEGVDSILANSQKIASHVGNALKLMNNSVFNNVELLLLIPAVYLGYKAISKKLKRRKNEQQ